MRIIVEEWRLTIIPFLNFIQLQTHTCVWCSLGWEWKSWIPLFSKLQHSSESPILNNRKTIEQWNKHHSRAFMFSQYNMTSGNINRLLFNHSTIIGKLMLSWTWIFPLVSISQLILNKMLISYIDISAIYRLVMLNTFFHICF